MCAMEEIYERTVLVLGAEAVKKLKNSRVAVFGLGGVGGYVVEALARAGVGALDLIDGDSFTKSNLNRQILALESTVGRAKAEVAKERVLAINPHICANERSFYFNESTADSLDFSGYDYVVDAIDSVADKLLIITRCQAAGTPVISCMGTGNKLNPMAFEVADIYKTSVCPLARVMRRELKSLGVKSLKVVFSREEPTRIKTEGKYVTGSVSFVPPAAGLLLASEVVKDIINGR